MEGLNLNFNLSQRKEYMYSENIILRKAKGFRLLTLPVEIDFVCSPNTNFEDTSYTDKGFVTFLKLTHSGAKDIGIPEKKALEALFFDTSIIGLGYLDVLSAF